MHCVSGRIFTEEGFVEGHICFENGKITEVCSGLEKHCDVEGLILPGLVNAHTHIADYVVPVDLNLSLEELVAPPNGFKHRMLQKTSQEKLRDAVSYISEYMFQRGTTEFIDFREGSTAGAEIMSSAKAAKPHVLGKPFTFEKEELCSLIDVADGFGPSSISDWNYEDLKELSNMAHAKGKMFGIHCSERVREDIGKVLDLKPSFVVHMTKAEKEDFKACADENVPVVSCPRSNMFFGNEPPLKMMLEEGVTVALGTDNAMIAMPDMFCEMEFAARLLRKQGVNSLDDVVAMVSSNGRKIINHKQKIWIRSGDICNLTVAEDKGGDPVTDLTLRNAGSSPLMVCSNNNIWTRGKT